MSRPSSPKHDHPGKSADQLADHFLASHDGLSFDFDNYHLTIGRGVADRIQGTADRDYVRTRRERPALRGCGR